MWIGLCTPPSGDGLSAVAQVIPQTLLYMQLEIAPCPDPFDSKSAKRPPQVPGCLKCHRVTHRLASVFTADTDYQRTRTDRLRKWTNYVNRGCTSPRKIEKPPPNSRRKKRRHADSSPPGDQQIFGASEQNLVFRDLLTLRHTLLNYNTHSCITRSWDTPVTIVTWVRTRQPSNYSSTPSKDQRLISFPKGPHRLWGLLKGTASSYIGDKAAGE